MSAYANESMSQFHPLQEEDIISTRDSNGWLTDAAIVHIVLTYGNLESGRNLVDPSWLATWVGEDFPILADCPECFLQRSPSSAWVTGLVIPYCVDNSHWVTIFVDLDSNAATLYDSSRNWRTTGEISDVMHRFYEAFWYLFRGTKEFRFKEGNCALQEDGSSCGVLTCLNVLALLDFNVPAKFVRPGYIMLKRRSLAADLRAKWEGMV